MLFMPLWGVPFGSGYSLPKTCRILEKCKIMAIFTLEKCKITAVFTLEKCKITVVFTLEKCNL